MNNCLYSWSRMSAVEITRVPGATTPPDDEVKTDKAGCGMAFMNGRCDSGKDVLDCIWNKPSVPGIRNCDGENMIV